MQRHGATDQENAFSVHKNYVFTTPPKLNRYFKKWRSLDKSSRKTYPIEALTNKRVRMMLKSSQSSTAPARTAATSIMKGIGPNQVKRKTKKGWDIAEYLQFISQKIFTFKRRQGEEARMISVHHENRNLHWTRQVTSGLLRKSLCRWHGRVSSPVNCLTIISTNEDTFSGISFGPNLHKAKRSTRDACLISWFLFIIGGLGRNFDERMLAL